MSIYPSSYESSRQRFRESLMTVQAFWPQARLESHRVSNDEDVTIDWIWAEALHTPQRCLVCTTGQHGIEGYVGSAMLKLLSDEFLPRLNPETTGLLLVHAINPWGMKRHRRVNAHNVDLNRNFRLSEDDFAHDANTAYDDLDAFLNPQRRVKHYALESLRFMGALGKVLLSPGQSALQAATLQGQHRFPQGVYYGGHSYQDETRLMMGLHRRVMQTYEQVVALDMHTGYGPRGQMTIVNSALESRPPDVLSADFAYPHVVSATADAFYVIQGDAIDWLYAVQREAYPDRKFYATTFEFGTLGDSVPALARSLQAIIMENQAFWHGADESARQKIAQAFQALFFPQDEDWQTKALVDARRALTGILRAFGFIDV